MSSPLLTLPAELRNQVWTAAVEDSVITITQAGQLSLSPFFGLARTNKQIRREFTSILKCSAIDFTAHVRDLDFEHVMLFLERFNDRIGGQRKIIIALEIHERDSIFTPDRLQAWVEFVAKLSVGDSIDIQYLPAEVPRFCRAVWAYQFKRLIDRYDGREAEELEKIRHQLGFGQVADLAAF